MEVGPFRQVVGQGAVSTAGKRGNDEGGKDGKGQSGGPGRREVQTVESSSSGSSPARSISDILQQSFVDVIGEIEKDSQLFTRYMEETRRLRDECMSFLSADSSKVRKADLAKVQEFFSKTIGVVEKVVHVNAYLVGNLAKGPVSRSELGGPEVSGMVASLVSESVGQLRSSMLAEFKSTAADSIRGIVGEVVAEQLAGMRAECVRGVRSAASEACSRVSERVKAPVGPVEEVQKVVRAELGKGSGSYASRVKASVPVPAVRGVRSRAPSPSVFVYSKPGEGVPEPDSGVTEAAVRLRRIR